MKRRSDEETDDDASEWNILAKRLALEEVVVVEDVAQDERVGAIGKVDSVDEDAMGLVGGSDDGHLDESAEDGVPIDEHDKANVVDLLLILVSTGAAVESTVESSASSSPHLIHVAKTLGCGGLRRAITGGVGGKAGDKEGNANGGPSASEAGS